MHVTHVAQATKGLTHTALHGVLPALACLQKCMRPMHAAHAEAQKHEHKDSSLTVLLRLC